MTRAPNEICLTPDNAGVAVATKATNYSLLASQPPKSSEKWSAIFATLHEWWENPSLLDYDEIEPPSVEMIEYVLEAGKNIKQVGFEGPDSVAPDGEGGIGFEWRHQRTSRLLIFETDGTVDDIQFENSKIIRRVRH